MEIVEKLMGSRGGLEGVVRCQTKVVSLFNFGNLRGFVPAAMAPWILQRDRKHLRRVTKVSWTTLARSEDRLKASKSTQEAPSLVFSQSDEQPWVCEKPVRNSAWKRNSRKGPEDGKGRGQRPGDFGAFVDLGGAGQTVSHHFGTRVASRESIQMQVVKVTL